MTWGCNALQSPPLPACVLMALKSWKTMDVPSVNFAVTKTTRDGDIINFSTRPPIIFLRMFINHRWLGGGELRCLEVSFTRALNVCKTCNTWQSYSRLLLQHYNHVPVVAIETVITWTDDAAPKRIINDCTKSLRSMRCYE